MARATPGTEVPDDTDTIAKVRPDVTQKDHAIIGEFRTDALHRALQESPIDDTTMIALLVLALSGLNASVHSGLYNGRPDRDTITADIIEGGVLTSDLDRIRSTGRAILTTVLSCRDNMSNSGTIAKIATEAIGAFQHLPHMPMDEFLKCLSRAALEKEANAAGVRIEVRVKDIRAAPIKHLNGSTYVHPNALFQLTGDELTTDRERRNRRYECSNWDDETDRATAADLDDAQNSLADLANENDVRGAGTN